MLRPDSASTDSTDPSGAPNARVVLAHRADQRVLAQLLARAFRDDPVQRWIFPTEADWRRGSAALFLTLVAERIRAGATWTTPDCAGAALWSPPESPHPALLDRLRIALRFITVLGRRFGEVASGLGSIEEQRPREAHWYLSVLGTDPQRQGRGVGSALLAPVLDRCDRDGFPAYLESSKEENIAFYARHHFEVVGRVALPGGPFVWTMSRESQAARLPRGPELRRRR